MKRIIFCWIFTTKLIDSTVIIHILIYLKSWNLEFFFPCQIKKDLQKWSTFEFRMMIKIQKRNTFLFLECPHHSFFYISSLHIPLCATDCIIIATNLLPLQYATCWSTKHTMKILMRIRYIVEEPTCTWVWVWMNYKFFFLRIFVSVDCGYMLFRETYKCVLFVVW